MACTVLAPFLHLFRTSRSPAALVTLITVSCVHDLQWPALSPQTEGFAQLTCQDNELPAPFVNLITSAMELQIGDYRAHKDVDLSGRVLTVKLDVCTRRC